MRCEQAEMLMAELLAGEIRAEERPSLERHLVECGGCRADFASARAGFRVEWPETAPSARAVHSLLALFREPPAILRALRFGTVAAASVAAALLILVSGGGQRPEEKPSIPAAAPPRFLASMQEAVVGSLEAKDEEGRPAGELGLQSHSVSVEILDGVAKTTVEENFRNHTDRRLEGTFRFPLPPDASISRLALEVNGKIEEGTCLERDKAREVFEGIVRRMKDPALLEWMPGGMFQCRIFPIEPRATKRVIVAYTQALPYFRGTMTYVYPLTSEKTKAHPPEELRIDVAARFGGELRKIESPSHRLDVQRARPNEARATFFARNLRPENDFVLTMETADEELRVIPHRREGEDGYFALFLTPRGAPARTPGRYAFVLDVSASVTGPELEVARRVVRSMMERRIEGDRFEIVAHHIDVVRSGEVDLRAANDFMDRLSPVGGCDLLGALRSVSEEAEVIYVGCGTPTYGETDGAKIVEALKGRKIRAVGVGSRANAALLQKLGGYFQISPNENVQKRCAEIAATLGSPALADIKLDGGDAVYDVVGVRDIFFGERLVVTGRTRGRAAKLVVTGRGYRRELEVSFPENEEGNNYVRRLWAQRKIADLLALPDKKAEVTELGIRHQIMTPYTSFLVLESEQMWKDHQLKREVQKEDEVLGRKGKSTVIPDEPTLEERIQRSFQEGADLFKLGKNAEALAKFEEAFQLKPSSDQMYACMKRVGVDLVARIMNDPDRKVQDCGRRIFELSKPGEPLREVTRPESSKRPEELKPPSPPPAPRVEPPPIPKPKPPPIKTPEIAPSDLRVVAEEEMRRVRQLTTIRGNDADMQVFVRQMEVQLAQIQDLTTKVEEHRVKLARALNEKTLATAEMQYARQQVEKLTQDLAELEGKHIEMARDKKSLEEKINHVNTLSLRTGPELEQGGDRGGSEGLESWNVRSQTFHGLARLDPLYRIPRTYRQTTGGWGMDPLELTTSPSFAVESEATRNSLAHTHFQYDFDLYQLPFDAKEIGGERGIFKETTNGTVPGAPITDALPALGDIPIVGNLHQLGVRTEIAPKKPLEGKVTAVANDIGLVVISIGKDDGVLEGDEFTVYRGGDFVARIQIDRSDRRWAAGKVVLKSVDPRVGDDVSNHIFVSAAGRVYRRPVTGTEEVEIEPYGEEDVLLKTGAWTLQPGKILALSRDGTFVALAQAVQAVGVKPRARIVRELSVGQPKAGDKAKLVIDLPAFLRSLPAGIRIDLASREGLKDIRFKMGPVEAPTR